MCKKPLLADFGREDAPYLLAGEFPGYKELIECRVFVGETGKILDRELSVAKIPRDHVRLTNLWGHARMMAGNKTAKTECYDWFAQELLRKMEGRKAVLLMGSDLAEAYLEHNVSELAGLWVQSRHFPKGVKVMMMPNPAVALRNPLGEIRLSLSKFGEYIRRYEK
jgi:uracil-DNA glycosylase family 4